MSVFAGNLNISKINDQAEPVIFRKQLIRGEIIGGGENFLFHTYILPINKNRCV